MPLKFQHSSILDSFLMPDLKDIYDILYKNWKEIYKVAK